MSGWPQRGRCGACGRPAQQFPSLRWEHFGLPCALRSRTLWSVDDDVPPCVFIPDGEALPQPRGFRLAPIEEEGTPYPSGLAVHLPEHRAFGWDAVRARLADEAESRT